MPIQPVLDLLCLAIVGLGAGLLVAALSYVLPQVPHHERRPYRYAILAVACALVGIGASLWATAMGHGLLIAAFTALFGWQLVLIGLIDAENHWLPDTITAPLAVTGIAAHFFIPPPFGLGWMMSVLSAIIAFGVLWLLAALYKKLRKVQGLGGGDPILLGAGCAWVGLGAALNVLIVACLVALVVTGFKAIRKSGIGLQTRLPYGTYMAIGFAVVWLLR